MKSVLMSIQPKWCELIASGKKTVEVRKTRPKVDEPFKCYIYCTKSNKEFLQSRNNILFYCENKDFIGGHGVGLYKRLNGKVMGEFVCDSILDMRDVEKEPTCLTTTEWLKYTDGHKGIVWGWHISDLVIYDKPKELSEFRTICVADGLNPYKCDKCEYSYKENYEIGVYEECCCNNLKPLKRPPQSWCYVVRKEDEK